MRGETAKLTASDGAANEALGFSVALDGDTIVAGAPAPFDEIRATLDHGAAYTLGAGARRRAGRPRS